MAPGTYSDASAQELGVLSDFDPAHEADRRSQFLADLLAASGLRTLVVGISGGVDSATVGMLSAVR